MLIGFGSFPASLPWSDFEDISWRLDTGQKDIDAKDTVELYRAKCAQLLNFQARNCYHHRKLAGRVTMNLLSIRHGAVVGCVLLSALALSACNGSSTTQTSTQTDTSTSTSTDTNVQVNVKTNAAGDSDVHVSAPGTQIDTNGTDHAVNIEAPGTSVQKDPNTGEVNIKAPFVNIHKDPSTGETDINVPFVHIHKHHHHDHDDDDAQETPSKSE